ncbi:hypothetical protein [Neorhizobium tomejilense]|uniref:hypothetical protein n=1 Tax=Neorhizobium tomejilense TaxID=2093828 RepID=UPI00155F0E20|nr:hypothetical protein [Neorhizobium tomejilense]
MLKAAADMELVDFHQRPAQYPSESPACTMKAMVVASTKFVVPLMITFRTFPQNCF